MVKESLVTRKFFGGFVGVGNSRGNDVGFLVVEFDEDDSAGRVQVELVGFEKKVGFGIKIGCWA